MSDNKPVSDSSPSSSNQTAAPVKKSLNWDRTMDIVKIAVTFYAACIGTFVTMQYNERQHELARLQAIANMLPHLSESANDGSMKGSDSISGGVASTKTSVDSDSTSNIASGDPSTALKAYKSQSKSSLSRDGAIWAIFRTANNKTMLRDLAALFPEDIYRVVSSIAVSGGLERDGDAITALQVTSEKLANKYSDEGRLELANRLYTQALRLKQHKFKEDEPLNIVDLNEEVLVGPQNEETLAETLHSLNKLGDIHRKESENSTKPNTGRWTARQFYKRVIKLGAGATSEDAVLQVAQADEALAELSQKDKHMKTAVVYLQQALEIKTKFYGADNPEVKALQEQIRNLSQSAKADPSKAKP